MKRPTALILGANSDIGQACAYRYAQAGYDLALSYRQPDTADPSLHTDLHIRYQSTITAIPFTAGVTNAQDLLHALPFLPDVAIICIGSLAEGDQLSFNTDQAQKIITDNFAGLLPVLQTLTVTMVKRGNGSIIGISSVAGERGRASNYLYGASKAGFTALLSGLRQHTSGTGVHIMTVKPGFVRTKMIVHLTTPNFLTSSPEQVAKQLFRAHQRGRSVIYISPIWRYIILIIKLIPEAIFQRLRL